MTSEGVERLGFLIHDAARLMRRSFEKRASEYGLSAAQWRLLVRLIKEEGMAQARLAELLEIEPISVSRLLDRMEEGQWIERRQAAHDRRVRTVFPTDKTRDVFAKIKAVAGEVYDHALTGLSADERLAMIHGLRVMVENLSAGDTAETICVKEAMK